MSLRFLASNVLCVLSLLQAPTQHVDAKSLLRDPDLAIEWRSKGIRSCCMDKNLYKKKSYMEIPWYAEANKKRFAGFFPSFCASNPSEC